MPPAPTDPAAAAPPSSLDQYARRVMSGEDRRVRSVALRAGLSVVEPLYASVTAVRNRLYDVGLFTTHRLPRPTVSVGNVTTGGTGKTPVVRWLAQKLRDSGLHVAVLSRGYRAGPDVLGDEQLMLDRALNSPVERQRVTILANPDRVAGAAEAMRVRPETDVFLLDDGFQHRRVARDLDVVLVSATNPFGYGHVLPRGMLREPLRGLARAGGFVVTHSDQVGEPELSAIDRTIRSYNPTAPLYRAAHAHARLRTPDAREGPASLPMEALRSRSWFAFCGIGDPATFVRQLQAIGGRCAGHRWFGDHHRYTAGDLLQLRRAAVNAGADVMVTTEKDWAKVSDLPSAADPPQVWGVEMEVRFAGDDERRLLDQVRGVLGGGHG